MPQTNGICERFHMTMLQEFYPLAHRLVIAVQRKRITMSNRNQFVPQFAVALLACGLIASLLPGSAAFYTHAGDIALRDGTGWMEKKLNDHG
jgi:hypothetical protein